MIFFICSFLICLILPIVLEKPLSMSRLSTNKEKPMLLGISVYAVVLTAALVLLNSRQKDASFLMDMVWGASALFFVGLIDDIRNLSVAGKLTGQIAAACIAVFFGIRTSIVFIPEWMNVVLSLFWIVALINAFNFLDIMDGLCPGISFIICATFLFLSSFSGALILCVFFCALAGATLAALAYNRPPARFYLGDSGSMLLGYIFACCALKIHYAVDISQRLALLVPLLIMSLPIFDLVFTVCVRKIKHIPVFKKSADHLVLLLMCKGYSQFKVLAIMYSLCLASGLSAILLQCLPPGIKPWVLSCFVLAIFVFTFICVKVTRAHA
ncbi:MAG: MraY family glycosyltransferase [Candidatus Omnitrophica bacterium]|nr:MraY family glycosyltransferase [Candidatus Omnitrophota bacterium]